MEKDRLLDELLKEHAKNGKRDDEAFLRELEEKIAEKGKVIEMPAKGLSAGTRWALGTGVAACLALGIGASYFWGTEEKDIIARHDVEVTSDAGAVSGRKNVVDELGEVRDRKPSAPALSEPSVVAERESAMVLEGRVDRQLAVEDLSLSADGDLADSFGKDHMKGKSDYPYAKKVPASPGFVAAQGVRRSMESNLSAPPAAEMHCFPVPGKPYQAMSGERYGELADNQWTAPVDERSSLSTFAVDVDTASYANVRRMINYGQQIPADSVRIEEMINYFDYQYSQPTAEHPFAVQVDSMAAPWERKHRLVRVGIQGKDIVRTERPAANLVFLLDVSGSMNSQDKLPLLKKSMQYLLEELDENDTVSIVVYAGASGLALPATAVDDIGRQTILQKMDSLSAGGSTAGGAGIQLAYKVAKEQFKKGGVNRILLATDGDFNVGVSDNKSLTKMVKERAKEGTYISVLGFGQGNINDAMLESITNNGNGNYNYIDSIKEGRKVLLEDMMGTMVTIAKDVKVQVQMNPSKVKAYRLIGYANRMLPAEAFLDKTVDAGEIGAGHTVTALYEIIPADGKPFGDQVDGSRYFEGEEKTPMPKMKESDELCFVKLAYKQPEQKVDDESSYFSVPFVDGKNEVSEDMQFAASVALFGMQLRQSEYKGAGDLDMVLDLAKKGKGADGKGQRAEFIQLVEKYQQRE
ncbi:von Willebrand factor type A domain-containing protein [Rubritalea spongiae]|uniref:von Willebrand factor type A domain-containing protein n=1 Tax=Rubritalea spongiae TaxID=430797 RepID=A0ABW5E1T7_9BACT